LLVDAESLLFETGARAELGISDIIVTPAYLWPTDDRMTPVYINYRVTGEGPVERPIPSVTANEPI
ncbi:hypothetical protein LCGC14_1131470, partial [marine sediment metagenome]